MELDKQLFEALTGSAGMRFDKVGVERRRSNRIPVGIRGTIIPMAEKGPGKPAPVKLREISPTGLSFVINGELPVTGLFAMILPLPKGGQIRLLYEIVRQQQQQGALVIGARYLRQLEASAAGAPVTEQPAFPSAPKQAKAPVRTVGSVVRPQPAPTAHPAERVQHRQAPAPRPAPTAPVNDNAEMERIRQAMMS